MPEQSPTDVVFRSFNIRLIKAVVALGLLFTLISIALRLGFAWHDEQAALSAQLDAAASRYTESLGRALWDVDQEQVDSLLHDLAKAPGIAAVKLTTAVGQEHSLENPQANFNIGAPDRKVAVHAGEATKNALGELSLYGDRGQATQQLSHIAIDIISRKHCKCSSCYWCCFISIHAF